MDCTGVAFVFLVKEGELNSTPVVHSETDLTTLKLYGKTPRPSSSMAFRHLTSIDFTEDLGLIDFSRSWIANETWLH